MKRLEEMNMALKKDYLYSLEIMKLKNLASAGEVDLKDYSEGMLIEQLDDMSTNPMMVIDKSRLVYYDEEMDCFVAAYAPTMALHLEQYDLIDTLDLYSERDHIDNSLLCINEKSPKRGCRYSFGFETIWWSKQIKRYLLNNEEKILPKYGDMKWRHEDLDELFQRINIYLNVFEKDFMSQFNPSELEDAFTKCIKKTDYNSYEISFFKAIHMEDELVEDSFLNLMTSFLSDLSIRLIFRGIEFFTYGKDSTFVDVHERFLDKCYEDKETMELAWEKGFFSKEMLPSAIRYCGKNGYIEAAYLLSTWNGNQYDYTKFKARMRLLYR